MPIRTIRLAAVTVGAAALVATACSSESAPAEQSSTSVIPTAHGAFARCLTEHGVPAGPGPASGPPPYVDQDTWRKAMQACSTLGPGPPPG